MKTNFHTVEDLLADESFLAWHSQTNENAVQAWNEWILADPANKEMAAEAVKLLQCLQVAEKGLDDEQLNAAADRLLNTIKKLTLPEGSEQ